MPPAAAESVKPDKSVAVEVQHIVQIPKTIEKEKVVTATIDRVERLSIEKPFEVKHDRLVIKEVNAPVDQIVERVVQTKVNVPVERTVERIVEKPVDRTVEKIVNKVVERIVQKPYDKIVKIQKVVPVFRTVERKVEVPVEQVVVRKIEVPYDRIVEKVVEVPVEQVVEKKVEVTFETYIDKIVHVNKDVVVEKVVEIEVDEEIIEVPVIEERTIVSDQIERITLEAQGYRMPEVETVPPPPAVPIPPVIEEVVIQPPPLEKIRLQYTDAVAVPATQVVVKETSPIKEETEIKYIEEVVQQSLPPRRITLEEQGYSRSGRVVDMGLRTTHMGLPPTRPVVGVRSMSPVAPVEYYASSQPVVYRDEVVVRDGRTTPIGGTIQTTTTAASGRLSPVLGTTTTVLGRLSPAFPVGTSTSYVTALPVAPGPSPARAASPATVTSLPPTVPATAVAGTSPIAGATVSPTTRRITLEQQGYSREGRVIDMGVRQPNWGASIPTHGQSLSREHLL